MSKAASNNNYLQKKFRAWFKRVGAQGNWKDFFQEIEEEYRTPKRFYHTFHGHIDFCVRLLYHIPRKLIWDINAVELALIMHDSEMDFMGTDNEERSAQFTEDICRRMRLSESFAHFPIMFIRHTDHKGMPIIRDSQLTSDIDLAILGQDEKKFDEYEKNIRQEYAFVPEDVFKRERAKVLRYFLNRCPSIFLTEYFVQKYEKQARKNLRRSIEKLEQ
jgi:predicted metal-dependent HD superfamily phosphohydrolase